MPVAEFHVLQKAQKLAGSALIQIPIDRVKPSFVARVLVGNVVDDKTTIPDASANRMIMVCGHHEMQSIWYLADSSVLTFNLERIGRDARLKFVCGLVIASPQNFLCQDETHRLNPVVEPTEQAITVVNERTVLSKDFQHNDAERALARALLAAFEYNNDSGLLVGILHSPCQPSKEIFEFLLVAGGK